MAEIITRDAVKVIVADEINKCQKEEAIEMKEIRTDIKGIYNRIWWILGIGVMQLFAVIFFLANKLIGKGV